MFPDREEFERAKAELREVDAWCLANKGEIDRALNLEATGRIASVAISQILKGRLPLAIMAGSELMDAVNFGISFGYYLAKTKDQGTKVPDVFDDEFPRFDGDEGEKH